MKKVDLQPERCASISYDHAYPIMKVMRVDIVSNSLLHAIYQCSDCGAVRIVQVLYYSGVFG